jgi:hypothetical protein
MASSDYRIFPPIWTTDAMLVSSNVPDAIATTWTSGATFALGAYAGAAPVTGAAQAVYESLQNGNTNHALSDPLWWRFVANVYQAYNPATAYSIGHIVADNTNHLLYQAVAASTGAALTDQTKWVKLSSTNRWKMLDKVYNTQTERSIELVYEITPGQIYDHLVLLNVEGMTANLVQSISGWSQTINLWSHPVDDWWEFFYNVPTSLYDVTFVDIPPYPSSSLTLTISAPESTAKCGMALIGKAVKLGVSQWNPERSINDFSGASEDTFGNVTLIKRAYSKRLKMEIWIPPGYESHVTKVLEDHRATEIVVIGSELYALTLIYGFLGAWKVSPSNNSNKIASVEVKGLV